MKKVNYSELLNDNITFEKAEEIQIKYRNLLKRKERKSKYKSLKNISLLAGVDISYYSKNNIEWGIACVVLWDLKKNIMVNTSYAHDEVKFPYKPGFLGFRESKLISIAIKNASKSPELIICDGHGINHPKRFGEATQLGLALNIPSFGVAKNPFFGYSNWKEVKRIKGEKNPIWVYNPNTSSGNNEKLGYSICLSDGKKPVFISVGYNINIESALYIALKTSFNNRQPEPVYMADKFSRIKIEELSN